MVLLSSLTHTPPRFLLFYFTSDKGGHGKECSCPLREKLLPEPPGRSQALFYPAGRPDQAIGATKAYIHHGSDSLCQEQGQVGLLPLPPELWKVLLGRCRPEP